MYQDPRNDSFTSFILLPILYGSFLEILPVFDIYDVMYTKGIHVDEWDFLFSVMNVYILKIMSDLQSKFEGTFLCQA